MSMWGERATKNPVFIIFLTGHLVSPLTCRAVSFVLVCLPDSSSEQGARPLERQTTGEFCTIIQMCILLFWLVASKLYGFSLLATKSFL